MNHQFDYQMKNPLAWREDHVVSLSDNPVHLGGLSPLPMVSDFGGTACAQGVAVSRR